jgi:hypothetical protein
MRRLFWVLNLTAPAWCEESFGQQMLSGFGTAFGIIVVAASFMWLLFAYCQKFGGMGPNAKIEPHKVQDVGSIDRQKANAFATKEREAMRQPFVDNYKYPDFSQPDSPSDYSS